MSQSAAKSTNIVFDAELFRQLAAAGVSIEHIASCFLVTVEEMTDYVRKAPALLGAYSRGRGAHLIHLYNTLKTATSPTLIALMARTDGFGKAPKPKPDEDPASAAASAAATAESFAAMEKSLAAAKKPQVSIHRR